ncbi:hypothetical protein EJ07DRAFT_176572 [Lizonia empirigonia]|nr:hypothetical protein EJ07DRAFT_176572 [Lizonia empirigonia]
MSGSGLLSSMLCVNEPNVEDIANCFKRFNRMLCGMTARCVYKPEGRSAAGRAKVKLLTSDDTTGRVFQIKDVKLPGDSGTSFTIDGVSRSIYDYFKDVILPNGRTLNTNFPLVRDDSCAWIPLELLVFDGPQPLHGLGYRNKSMRDIIRTFLKKGGIDCLQALGKDLLGVYATIESDDGSISQPWLDARLTTVKDADRSVVAQGSIRIASVLSTGTHDVELIKRLTRGLFFHHYKVIDDPVMITGDDPHGKLEDPRCDLLLVIVDNRSSNKDEIGESTSLLRRTAELKWGTRVICLNRKNLLSMFNDRYDPGTYFPSSIRAKINCMLGQQNFNEARLEKALDYSTTMIVGAHIAHPSIYKECSPSIAAVVATTPESVVKFAGTARLQTTTSSPPEYNFGLRQPVGRKGARSYRHIELGIKSLGAMMQDLFKNWKDGAPTELIFFRDSAGLSEIDDLLRIECLKIEAAYDAAFPGRDAKSDLKLTFILVKKNSLEPPVSHQMPYYLPDNDRSKKYKYVIIHNDSKRDDLAHITGRLNESSQLNPHSEQQTSKSLPILHASKLCGRMHDYVRLDARLGEVNMPKILPTAWNVNDEMDKESMTVQQANNVLLDTYDKVSRQVPWDKKLDGTMFYL